MRRLVILAVLLAGCSSEKKLALVRARFEPPTGFELAKEEPGPPPRASYGSGLTLSRFDADLPKGDEDAVAAALPALAKLGSDWSVLSARAGSLPVGPVVRVELRRASGEMAMHYVVPRAHGFVLLSFVAPEASYGPLSARIERSLTSLKADP